MRDDLRLVPREDAGSSEFASMLKRLRTEAGLSQQMLAGRALVSVQAISALERGYRKAPYRETLDRLADALSLSPEVKAAFEAAAARARSSRPADRALAERPHNLPRQLTAFLGRDDVIGQLMSLVATSPLVTVVGTGGAGKTRSAIEAGAHLLDRFPNGVWLVELAHLTDPSLVPSAVAGALGVQESSQRPLLETLTAYLENKRLLLILDNCEHLIAEARRVTGSLLRACPGVGILATSREGLSVAGERVYRIPPLQFPKSGGVSASEALAFGAIALFVDRALAADARFELTEENVDAVVEICRRLDGLPLAIELAAARVTVLSPRQLAQRLDRVFNILTGGGYTTLPRHQTMRAVIDWSYGLLSSQSRLLFSRLAVFAGGFTLDGATALCADGGIDQQDVFELLSSLVGRSLVMVDFSRGDARYGLLEATRQYAIEKLVARGERETLARRHAAVYVQLAERLDRSWYNASENRWFEEAEAELDNCRVALEWALSARHDVPTGQRLAAALARVWYSLAPAEGRRWIGAALDAVTSNTPADIVAQLHIADAELHGALGQYKASFAAAERALDVLDRLDDPLQVARAKQTAGSALGALGRGPEGERLLQEALEAAASLENDRLRALVVGDLGTARSRRGDVDGARTFYAEALAFYNSHGLERPAASIAGHLAEVEFAAGDPAAALQRAEEARIGHEATHNRRSAANDLSNMAAYLVALDCFEDARAHAARALAAAHDVKATVLEAFVLQHLAAIGGLRAPRDTEDAHSIRARAARLLGFVDGRLASFEVTREHTERQEYERLLAQLQAELDRPELASLMDEGRDWTEERAIAEALERVPLEPAFAQAPASTEA